MIYHYHDDVLSVYFSDHSETILGDAGKYEYAWTPTRSYFKSPQAHNRIFRFADLSRKRSNHEVGIADTSWAVRGDGVVRIGGRTKIQQFEVTREVELPDSGPVLRVTDTFRPFGGHRTRRRRARARFAMTWNAGRDIRVFKRVGELQDNAVQYYIETRRGRRYSLRVSATGEGVMEHSLTTGGTRPLLGWYSPRHQVMRPNPVALISVTPTGKMSVTTVLEELPRPVPFLSGLRILMRGY
jgi:hypothetical protein